MRFIFFILKIDGFFCSFLGFFCPYLVNGWILWEEEKRIYCIPFNSSSSSCCFGLWWWRPLWRPSLWLWSNMSPPQCSSCAYNLLYSGAHRTFSKHFPQTNLNPSSPSSPLHPSPHSLKFPWKIQKIFHENSNLHTQTFRK